jgi:hypothetical protein
MIMIIIVVNESNCIAKRRGCSPPASRSCRGSQCRASSVRPRPQTNFEHPILASRTRKGEIESIAVKGQCIASRLLGEIIDGLGLQLSLAIGGAFRVRVAHM